MLPEGELSHWDERIAYLVASLFALYPEAPPWPESARQRWQRNLGASLRHLAAQTESAGPERRMVALLNSDIDDLPHHLRGIIGLLKAAKTPVPVDWVRLTWDLRGWRNAERTPQKAWANAFWGGQRAPAEAATAATSEDGQEPE
jgi:CRISPR type I-E-associated protein CasB/Cse2